MQLEIISILLLKQVLRFQYLINYVHICIQNPGMDWKFQNIQVVIPQSKSDHW